jgi:transcriptional regulator with XRE-family HTH domain
MGGSGISQIETGTRNPSVTTLSKIAEALGVEVTDLFPKEQAPLPDLDGERRPSLQSWIGFVRRLADRWEGEVEEREGERRTAKPGAKTYFEGRNMNWAVEIMDTYADVVEAFASDPNYDANVYASSEVHELYALAKRLKKAVDHTKAWFPSGQEDPQMAEVIVLRRAAIERAEKKLGARAS